MSRVFELATRSICSTPGHASAKPLLLRCLGEHWVLHQGQRHRARSSERLGGLQWQGEPADCNAGQHFISRARTGPSPRAGPSRLLRRIVEFQEINHRLSRIRHTAAFRDKTWITLIYSSSDWDSLKPNTAEPQRKRGWRLEETRVSRNTVQWNDVSR